MQRLALEVIARYPWQSSLAAAIVVLIIEGM